MVHEDFVEHHEGEEGKALEHVRADETHEGFEGEDPEILADGEWTTIEQIEQAKTLEDIKDILRDHEDDSSAFMRLSEAEEYLEEHFDTIMKGVLHGGHAGVRNELGERIRALPENQFPGIREKVRGLLKQKMDAGFREEKKRLVKEAISEAKDFSSLYVMVNQFKSVNVAEEYGEDVIDKDEAVGRIEAARMLVGREDKWVTMPKDELEDALDTLIREMGVPRDSGIRDKTHALLLEQAQKRRLNERHVQAQSAPREARSSVGEPHRRRWGQRIGEWFRKWF